MRSFVFVSLRFFLDHFSITSWMLINFKFMRAVTRTHFYAIEIARNKEGANSSLVHTDSGF
jgi:hypothetical protein